MALYREGQNLATESRTIYELVRELSIALIAYLLTVKNSAFGRQALLPD
jgi:hypothetical protein